MTECCVAIKNLIINEHLKMFMIQALEKKHCIEMQSVNRAINTNRVTLPSYKNMSGRSYTNIMPHPEAKSVKSYLFLSI